MRSEVWLPGQVWVLLACREKGKPRAEPQTLTVTEPGHGGAGHQRQPPYGWDKCIGGERPGWPQLRARAAGQWLRVCVVGRGGGFETCSCPLVLLGDPPKGVGRALRLLEPRGREGQALEQPCPLAHSWISLVQPLLPVLKGRKVSSAAEK